MKKYITPQILPAMLAAAAMLTACKSVEDAVPVNAAEMPSLTTMALLTEPEPEPVFETASSGNVTEEAVTSGTLPSDTETETSAETVTEKETVTETNAETISVESISLSTYSVSLTVGQSKMPIVTMLPENASDKSEIWTSSNTEIATVNELGNITAVSEGSCTVTVTSAQEPDIFAEVEVTVTEGIKPTYIDGILVVNKTYALPADYGSGIDPAAQAAFDAMQADAAAAGLNIYISSGYRSYDYQAGLYQRYVNKDGKAEADRYSARAGHSEHQTGLAFDLNTITEEFKDTAEGKWVAANCADYGFIVRYPADKEDITGYKFEPWHIRYLGVETAQAVYASGLCLEEYLGITSEYAE